MIYEYKCAETGEVTTVELPLGSDVPSSVKKDKKIYNRVWGCSVHIPFGWGNPNTLKFDKGPSDKKHLY